MSGKAVNLNDEQTSIAFKKWREGEEEDKWRRWKIRVSVSENQNAEKELVEGVKSLTLLWILQVAEFSTPSSSGLDRI